MNNLLELLGINSNEMNLYQVKFMDVNHDNTLHCLDELEENFSYYDSWLGWKNKNRTLGRRKVIGFVRDYHQDDKETWIYIGTYDVIPKKNSNEIIDDVAYDFTLDSKVSSLIGKLSIKYTNVRKPPSYLENIIDNITIDSLNYHFYRKTILNEKEWLKVINKEKKRKSKKLLKIIDVLYINNNHKMTIEEIALAMQKGENDIIKEIISFGERVSEYCKIKRHVYFNYYYIQFEFTLKNNDLYTVKLSDDLVKVLSKVHLNENYFDNIEKNLNRLKKEKFIISTDARLIEEKVSIKKLNVEEKNGKKLGKVNEVKDAVDQIINSAVGKEVEKFIYSKECEKLKNKISNMQKKQMERFFYSKRDGAGYDILSFELENGKYVEKYIEVKSTRKENSPINITENEYNVGNEKDKINHYYIYRVLIIDEKSLKLDVIPMRVLKNDYNIVSKVNYIVYEK